MMSTSYLQVNTSLPQESIWRGVSQQTLRQNIVALEDQAVYQGLGKQIAASEKHWEKKRRELSSLEYQLPLAVEQRLADDFAFLAAAEPGARATSAVCIEEASNTEGLVVRLAANGGVSLAVREAIEGILDLLVDCAQKRLPREDCATALLDLVVGLNRERIHAHLRSSHHQKRRKNPLRPLYQEIDRATSTPPAADSQCCYPSIADGLYNKLVDLSVTYRSIDDPSNQTAEDEIDILKIIARKSNDVYAWWSNHIIPSHPDKTCCFNRAPVREIANIGRYWSLCLDLAYAARKYRKLFTNIDLEILPPYRPLPSNITWLPNRPVLCTVHAEVQMVALYESDDNGVYKLPRVIGSSKPPCYLCDSFVRCHGVFLLSQQTRGKLHDRWIVPDLADYSVSGLKRLRTALVAMNTELKRALFSGTHAQEEPPRKSTFMNWLDFRPLWPSSSSPQRDNSPARSTTSTASSRSSSSSRRSVSSRMTSTSDTSSYKTTPLSSTTSFMPSDTRTPPTVFSSSEVAPSASRAARSTTSVSSVSSVSTSSSSSLSSTSSTNFLDSEDLFTGQTIDKDTALHVMANRTWMEFEMEGPRKGKVAVRPRPPPDGSPIDCVVELDEAKGGTTSIRVERQGRGKRVNLELVHPSRRPVFVTLEWL